MSIAKSKKVVISLFMISALIFPQQVIAAEVNPYGGAKIAPPADSEIIFTVTNGSSTKKYSIETLRKMKSSVIRVYEPFVKKQQSFRVIPMATFGSLSKISESSKLRTIALNDYVYTNTLKNFVSAKGYIAFERDGKPIPYDQGGPLRIIFPTDSKWSKFLDPWNWSLKSIVVK